MLGRISTGAIYGRPNIYTVSLATNNIDHDFKYVLHLAQKKKCVDIRKIKFFRCVDIMVYFDNRYNAQIFADLIRKCHLYDNDFKVRYF